MSSSSLLDYQLHVNAVIFRIREELLRNPMLTDIQLRDQSGIVVKTVNISTQQQQRRRRLSRKDNQLLTDSTTSLDNLSQFYSRFLPEASVVSVVQAPVVQMVLEAEQSQVQQQDESAVAVNMAIDQQPPPQRPDSPQVPSGGSGQPLPQPQQHEEKVDIQEEAPRYPKRDRQSIQQQQEQKYAETAPASKRRATTSQRQHDTNNNNNIFDDNKAQVDRYYRLFTKVYKTNISDDISWGKLLERVDATETEDVDDATYQAIATDLTAQRHYHHTFKLITYYLRGVLAINLKQSYQGKKYSQMAMELLDIQSPEDIAAYPQFSALIKRYYSKETQKGGDGLVYITALKAEIPWREWRMKSTRKLIEIALRRFYKNNQNERENDDYEYSETELPLETKDNEDIYLDDHDDDNGSDHDSTEDEAAVNTERGE